MHKQRTLLTLLLIVGFFLPAVTVGTMVVSQSATNVHVTQNPSSQQPVATRAMLTAPLSLLQSSHASASGTDRTFDSRLCEANPSSDTCNGVLPIGPHFTLASHDGGSGACFDGTQKMVEDQPITDENNKTIGDFQLWYLPTCFSYTTHVVVSDNTATVSATVQQYNGSGLVNLVTKVFWFLGDQDNLLPSATETTGPVQDRDVWSPMLYSPNDPIQGSATIESEGSGYAPISAYYTTGTATTINGKRF